MCVSSPDLIPLWQRCFSVVPQPGSRCPDLIDGSMGRGNLEKKEGTKRRRTGDAFLRRTLKMEVPSVTIEGKGFEKWRFPFVAVFRGWKWRQNWPQIGTDKRGKRLRNGLLVIISETSSTTQSFYIYPLRSSDSKG